MPEPIPMSNPTSEPIFLFVAPAPGRGPGARGDCSPGFTLIELLIVIGIISMLASLVLVGLHQAGQGARESAAQVEVANLNSALESYYADEGVYPGMGEGIDPDDPNQFPFLFEALFGRSRLEGGGGGRSAPYMGLRQDRVRVRDIDRTSGLDRALDRRQEPGRDPRPGSGERSRGEHLPATRQQLLDPAARKYIVDPWGAPYLYRANKGRRPDSSMRNASRADIYSLGKNGEDETWAGILEGDDVGNW